MMKPKPKRAKKIHLFMCEDGVKRDKTALKEKAEYAVHMKQKEKEDRIRKNYLTMRDLRISEYQQVRREKVYYHPRSTKVKNF